MAQPKDTTPAAPYPQWNDDGALICGRRLPARATCPELLGGLYLMRDPWGTTWRALLFAHSGWEEFHGYWRETDNAHRRRKGGWTAKTRTTPNAAPADEGGPQPSRGPQSYPTRVLCPRCGHKRLLDADALDVVPEVDVMRYMMARFLAPDDPAAWPRPGQMPPVDVMRYV